MKKISCNIGINLYDKRIYGSNANLRGCVNDAQVMQKIAKESGYNTTTLLDNQATVANFFKFLTMAANTIGTGDYLMISVSSHGTTTKMQGKDVNGICFTDGVAWDFQIKEYIKKFKKGTNIVWVTDCCFAEENFKFIFRQDGTVKYIDYSTLKNIQLPKSVKWVSSEEFYCNFIQYASSTKFQVSYDLGTNGLFTSAMKEALATFPQSNYYQLFQQIERNIKKTGYPQTPRFIVINGNLVKPKGLTFRKAFD
jgi:hypothetical protein